jgi:hypothetical protein
MHYSAIILAPPTGLLHPVLRRRNREIANEVTPHRQKSDPPPTWLQASLKTHSPAGCLPGRTHPQRDSFPRWTHSRQDSRHVLFLPESGDLCLRGHALDYQLLKPSGVFKSRPNLQRRISVRVGVEPKATLSRRNVHPPDLTDPDGPVPPKRLDLPNLPAPTSTCLRKALKPARPSPTSKLASTASSAQPTGAAPPA